MFSATSKFCRLSRLRSQSQIRSFGLNLLGRIRVSFIGHCQRLFCVSEDKSTDYRARRIIYRQIWWFPLSIQVHVWSENEVDLGGGNNEPSSANVVQACRVTQTDNDKGSTNSRMDGPQLDLNGTDQIPNPSHFAFM